MVSGAYIHSILKWNLASLVSNDELSPKQTYCEPLNSKLHIDLLELATAEGLAKGPIRRGNVVRNHRTAVTGGDREREALSDEVAVALPVLAPIPGHWLPPSV